MNWKLSTFALIALLLITLVVSYVITSDALRTASAATLSNRGRQADLDRAHAAVNDTQSFLNFFRVANTSDFTTDDYQREIETLKLKYLSHYPSWAETQNEPTADSPNRSQ